MIQESLQRRNIIVYIFCIFSIYLGCLFKVLVRLELGIMEIVMLSGDEDNYKIKEFIDIIKETNSINEALINKVKF